MLLWSIIWISILRHFTLWPRQNVGHFADDIFKCISLAENVCTLIKISLKIVQGVPFKDTPPLLQIVAWCWTVASHYLKQWGPCLFICVTRPWWVNHGNPLHWRIFTSLDLEELIKTVLNTYRWYSVECGWVLYVFRELLLTYYIGLLSNTVTQAAQEPIQVCEWLPLYGLKENVPAPVIEFRFHWNVQQFND